jgi:hypothetical protein
MPACLLAYALGNHRRQLNAVAASAALLWSTRSITVIRNPACTINLRLPEVVVLEALVPLPNGTLE